MTKIEKDNLQAFKNIFGNDPFIKDCLARNEISQTLINNFINKTFEKISKETVQEFITNI